MGVARAVERYFLVKLFRSFFESLPAVQKFSSKWSLCNDLGEELRKSFWPTEKNTFFYIFVLRIRPSPRAKRRSAPLFKYRVNSVFCFTIERWVVNQIHIFVLCCFWCNEKIGLVLYCPFIYFVASIIFLRSMQPCLWHLTVNKCSFLSKKSICGNICGVREVLTSFRKMCSF